MKGSSLNQFLRKAENVIGGCLFFVMMFFTGINVFVIFSGHRRIAGLDEIVLAAYVWVTYIALGRHYKEGDNISVDFVVRIMPPRVQKVVLLLRDVATFSISLVMLVAAIDLTRNSFNKYTSLLRIPLGYIDLATVIGFGSVLAYILSMHLGHTESLTEEKQEEEELS